MQKRSFTFGAVYWLTACYISLISAQPFAAQPPQPAALNLGPQLPVLQRFGNPLFRVPGSITAFLLAENRGSVLVMTGEDSILREIDLKTGELRVLLDVREKVNELDNMRERWWYYHAADQLLIIAGKNGGVVRRVDLRQLKLLDDKTPDFRGIIGMVGKESLLVQDISIGYSEENDQRLTGPAYLRVQQYPNLKFRDNNTKTREYRAVACHPTESVYCTAHRVENECLLREYNIETKTETQHTINTPDSLSEILYTPDGQTLVLNQKVDKENYHKLLFYKRKTWELEREIKLPAGTGVRIRFLGNGQRIVTRGSGGQVSLIALHSPDKAETLGQLNFLPEMTSDGQQLIGVSGGNLLIFQKQNETFTAPVETGHQTSIANMLPTPDGEKLLSCGADGKLILWDLEHGRPELTNSPEHRVSGSGMIGWMNRGEQILCRTDREHCVSIDTRTLAPRPNGEYKLRIHHRWFRISDVDRQVYFPNEYYTGTGWTSMPFDPQAPRAKHTWHDFPVHPSKYSTFDFRFRSQELLTAIDVKEEGVPDYEITLLDLASGRITRKFTNKSPQDEFDQPGPIIKSFFADNEMLMMMLRGSNKLYLWDAAAGQLLTKEPVAYQSRVSVTLDGRFWAWANHDQFQVLDLYQKKLIWEQKIAPHTMNLLMWLPGKKQRLATTNNTGLITIWDASALIDRQSKLAPLTAAEWDTAWQKLETGTPHEALQARWRWQASGEAGIAALEARYPFPEVDPKLADKVKQLLEMLDQADFAQREKTTQQLLDLGESILPYIQEEALRQKPADARKRLEQHRSQLQVNKPERTPQVIQQLRGIAILERLASERAQQLLQKIADDNPQAETTRAAAHALRTLKLNN